MRISDWSSDVCSSDFEGRARLLTRAERIFVRTQFDQRAPVGAGRLAGNIGSDAADPRLGPTGFGRVGHAAPFNGYAPQVQHLVQHVDSLPAPAYPLATDGNPSPPHPPPGPAERPP